MHGEGVFCYKNGSKYDGDWIKGKRHGQGSLNTKKGNYLGLWEND